jgi:hypothetical protein
MKKPNKQSNSDTTWRGNSQTNFTAGIQPTHNYSCPSQFSQFNSPDNTKRASQTKTSTNYIISNGTSFHPD